MTVGRWRVLVALAAPAMAMALYAQGSSGDSKLEPNPSYDGRYAFVRLRYATEPGGPTDACTVPTPEEGPGWHHDYPRADQNLIQATVEVSALDARTDRTLLLDADDPELLRYPIAYLTEPGCWRPSPAEVEALRAYLLKGGVLLVDDLTFGIKLKKVGSHIVAVEPDRVEPTLELARRTFEEQIQRVLPEGQIVQLDAADPLFQVFFAVDPGRIPRLVPNAPATEFRGIYEDNDPTKRLLVVAVYNNALGENWRRSGQGFYPIERSNEAYKFGVNYILYGLTH